MLVRAAPARPGECLPGLEPLLGPEGCARLQAVLTERTLRWAQAVAPDRVVVADAGEDRAAAAATAFERFEAGAPLLAVQTGVVRLSPEHAQAALSDLAAGTDVSFGPASDGGYYLLALARPTPELFDLPEDVWDGPLVLPKTIQVAARLGLEGGLLRMERVLATPADADALLVDPLTPADVRSPLAYETNRADR